MLGRLFPYVFISDPQESLDVACFVAGYGIFLEGILCQLRAEASADHVLP